MVSESSKPNQLRCASCRHCQIESLLLPFWCPVYGTTVNKDEFCSRWKHAVTGVTYTISKRSDGG